MSLPSTVPLGFAWALGGKRLDAGNGFGGEEKTVGAAGRFFWDQLAGWRMAGERKMDKMSNINKIGKKSAITAYRIYMRLFESLFDKFYLDPNVPMSKLVSHSKWFEYLLKIGNHKGIKILEIGSREVTGKSDARKRFSNAQYVGFDYYPGPNVDVVGDAHKLSQYFDNQEFDIIYSSAVFEHFAMPWVVATEIAKVLKVDGIIFIETHFSFGSHERPWHFFQFSDMALKMLFAPALGFECIEAGASNPIVGRFSSLADDYLKFRQVTGLYCHSEYLGRKIKEVVNFDWNGFDLEEIVGDKKYPLPKTEQ